MLLASDAHRALLGDGDHPAPQRRRDDQGVRQRRVPAGQHRQARVPGCVPVRGHSNVQGDRTMGIWEKVPDHFLDALEAEYGFEPPREHGLDTVDSIRALRDGKARFFMGMGGNFVSAAPDTVVTEEAMEQAELTVQVSTKLNRSHVRCGRTALILPALGRSERDLTGGIDQRVTVEDSCRRCTPRAVRSSRRASTCARRSTSSAAWRRRRSAPTARCRGRSTAPTTRTSGGRSPTSFPAVRRTTRRSSQPGGFVLPHPPRDNARVPDRDRQGASSRASPMDVLQVPRGTAAAAGPAQPRPVQHHDLRPQRPLPRHLERPTGDLRAPRRHPRLGVRRRRRGRHGQRVGGRHRAVGALVPHRLLRHAARLRRGVLPRGEPAGAARLDGQGQQQPHLEVGGRPAGAGVADGEATSTTKGAPIGSDRGHKSDVQPDQLS